MSRNTEQEARNKAFVLEAFEALFNRRDCVAAEKYWSPDYIQHSAHIPPGREGLFALIRGLPATMRYENALKAAWAKGDKARFYPYGKSYAEIFAEQE